ncbi:FAD-dependent oxidoreductase [Salicola sp. Rm-C-2C1-2]|uniref:FAD-dependent oxidoreductase n=1 Tax=Salicola sp. Rm-C-2C1-2 TaxID=3141321 RepID=UPI0032E44D41
MSEDTDIANQKGIGAWSAFLREGWRAPFLLGQGDGVASIDRISRAVITTGSRPAMPCIEGNDLEGVTGFRTLRDARWMAECGWNGGNAVVLGGGFLGLEAVEGLRAQGMTVSVVHRGRWPLNRQLDETAVPGARAWHLAKHTARRPETSPAGNRRKRHE